MNQLICIYFNHIILFCFDSFSILKRVKASLPNNIVNEFYLESSIKEMLLLNPQEESYCVWEHIPSFILHRWVLSYRCCNLKTGKRQKQVCLFTLHDLEKLCRHQKSSRNVPAYHWSTTLSWMLDVNIDQCSCLLSALLFCNAILSRWLPACSEARQRLPFRLKL